MTAYYLVCLALVFWITSDDDVPTWAIFVPAGLVLLPMAVLVLAVLPLPNRTPKDTHR
ncbi:hypothetical protein O4215_20510 [Rhodococcus maanshanensis]|uniref:hypothetical protein n=1 Tax=Rhodococcus maanshanensis TaxID=183556 RepID=UPI0022B33FD4|nr:hypothetical protein [Rhodococcus maanshanensis]MCZ4557947.1 hypothetical protein [Rhodococcus maanshanensis]